MKRQRYKDLPTIAARSVMAAELREKINKQRRKGHGR